VSSQAKTDSCGCIGAYHVLCSVCCTGLHPVCSVRATLGCIFLCHACRFAEANSRGVLRNAAAYINVDSATSGPMFSAGASPSLITALVVSVAILGLTHLIAVDSAAFVLPLCCFWQRSLATFLGNVPWQRSLACFLSFSAQQLSSRYLLGSA
jgi:hypothetical protein